VNLALRPASVFFAFILGWHLFNWIQANSSGVGFYLSDEAVEVVARMF
jgi:hypothetical protein